MFVLIMVLELVGNPIEWQLFRSPFWKFCNTKKDFVSLQLWILTHLFSSCTVFVFWSQVLLLHTPIPVAPHPTITIFTCFYMTYENASLFLGIYFAQLPWVYVTVLSACNEDLFIQKLLFSVMWLLSCTEMEKIIFRAPPAASLLAFSSLSWWFLWWNGHQCQMLKSENDADLKYLSRHIFCVQWMFCHI